MKTNSATTVSGTQILIAVKQGAAPKSMSRAKTLDSSQSSRLEQLGKTIAEVCTTLHKQVAEGLQSHQPDEVTIEFGVSLTSSIGIPLITDASAEASFQISATWRRGSQA